MTNIQQSTTEETDMVREMAGACDVARSLFPDEAIVQAYAIARFLGDPQTFATNKRLLETVLRRHIGLAQPYSPAAFYEAIDRLDRAGKSAEIVQFPGSEKR